MSGGSEQAQRGPAPEHRDLLRQRAALLARVPRRQRQAELVQVIVFTLGAARFGLNAACVLEAAVLRELTPLPGASVPLFGVTHWRGRVLTVLDLRAALGVQPQGLTDLGRIIVVDGPDRLFALVVDEVVDILDIDMQRLAALPEDERDGASLLRGLGPDSLLVIDERLLLERYGSMREPRTSTGRGRVR